LVIESDSGPTPTWTAIPEILTPDSPPEETPTPLIRQIATPTWTVPVPDEIEGEIENGTEDGTEDEIIEEQPGPTPTWTRPRPNLAGDPMLYTPTPESSLD